MFKDRKIRKAIKEATKPQKSFEEFCAENNIVISKNKVARKPRLVFAKIFAPIAFVCIISLSVILPLLNTDQNTPSNPPTPPSTQEPKIYGDNDAESIRLDNLDELIDNYILFNQKNVEDIILINRMQPIEEPDILLGYSLHKIAFGFFIDEIYAFEFDYLIRCYENYQFSQLSLFNELNKQVVYNDITFDYIIKDNHVGAIAYITFKVNDYDYYIILNGYQGMTLIDDDTVELFINNAF